MSQFGLGTFVTYNPASVHEETTVLEALRRMDRFAVRHLPVIDHDRNIVGIVSEFDLVRATNPDRVAGAPAGSDHVKLSPDCPVKWLMTHDVATINLHDSPEFALETMMQRGFHSLPVVDDGRLAGIVTSADFLREFSYGEHPACDDPVSQHMADASAQIGTDATRSEALALMKETGLAYLSVVTVELPMGVVSERSLRGVGRDRSRRGVPARSAARRTEIPVTGAPIVRPADSLARAAATMVEENVKAANVARRGGGYVGLLTEDHILRVMLPQRV